MPVGLIGINVIVILKRSRTRSRTQSPAPERQAIHHNHGALIELNPENIEHYRVSHRHNIDMVSFRRVSFD